MKMVTIEEFSKQLTELLKWSEETGGQIQIVDNERVVAILSGVKKPRSWTQEERAKWWREWDELAQKIAEVSPSNTIDAAQLVKEQRREL